MESALYIGVGEHGFITNAGLFPEQQLVIKLFTSIIYFLPLFFFPSSSRPWPNVKKNVTVCAVCVILLLYSHIELGDVGQLAKEKNLLFED